MNSKTQDASHKVGTPTTKCKITTVDTPQTEGMSTTAGPSNSRSPYKSINAKERRKPSHSRDVNYRRDTINRGNSSRKRATFGSWSDRVKNSCLQIDQ